MEWNLNGWFSDRNPDYLQFKINVIEYLNIDIVVIPETHCMENKIIKIDNYTLFQQNRPVTNANVKKGSGGLAIAIKNSLLHDHYIEAVLKNSTDGLLGLKLVHSETNFKVGIMANYLSPSNYHYGQDPEGYFNQATSMWQDLSDCDLCIGTGDVNARTKQIKDFIPEIDGNIPDRTNPDIVKNSHGNSFLTFLKDNRAVILNGRVTPHLNNFTFVSTRGSSVPDYMYCPIEQLDFCTEMRTVLMTDIVNMTNFVPPQHLPDHSILIGTFKTCDFETLKPDNTLKTNRTLPQKPPKKNIKKMDKNFFLNDEINKKIADTIFKLENAINNQSTIDNLWIEIKEMFLSELSSLPDLPTSTNKKPSAKYKKSKEYSRDCGWPRRP